VAEHPPSPQNQDHPTSASESGNSPYEEGKRAGAHPLVVVFGVIVGLWLLIWIGLPNPKDKQGTVPFNPEAAQKTRGDEQEAAPVIFKVQATVSDLNAVSLLIPAQATESQIVGLLRRFREARLADTLITMLPPTTPKHKLGEHAVADIYIFSDPAAASAETVRVLSRGAHAPGDLYPQAIPFEDAMEKVRGHYRIDLHDTGHPDRGSVGFADESGVHSKTYRPIF
jgi:hypothetical protein